MSNGMGSQDDELTRREQIRSERLRDATENAAVAGSSPDDRQTTTCTGANTAEMLAAYKRTQDDTTMTKEKQKLKSPKYSDVPAYSLEALDTETLKNEVFETLDFTDAEKEAAGALVNHTGKGLSQAGIADRSSVSATTISRVKRILTTQKNPSKKQRNILRVARENPDAPLSVLSKKSSASKSLVRTVIRAFRHERIACVVEVEENDDETQETREDDDDRSGFNGEQDDEQDDESDVSDAVQKDLAGDDDVTYKYDTDSSTAPKTRSGKKLEKSAIDDVGDLLDILREQERRLKEVEARDPEQVPKALEGRIASLETRVEGVQSVADRIEDQQAQVERFVEDELGRDVDFDALEEDVQDLKEQCQGITDAAELEWEETSLGQRVERIEASLESHKSAIANLREKETPEDCSSSLFSTEEKKNLVVALAQNGEDALIEKVIEEV